MILGYMRIFSQEKEKEKRRKEEKNKIGGKFLLDIIPKA